MSLYCENTTQATIIYTDINGNEQKINTKNVPIDVACEESNRTGKYIYEVAVSGYTGNCQPIGDRAFRSTHIADSYTIGQGTPVNGYESCAWYSIIFKIDNVTVSSANVGIDYLVTQLPNPNYSKGGKQIVIKSSNGTEIFREQVKDCNFKISCGEDCPPNHIKCNCDSYPGYCCIPCSEIRNEIAAMTAKVRGLNNG